MTDVTLDDVPVLDPEGDTGEQLTRLTRIPFKYPYSIHVEDVPPGKIRNAFRAQLAAPSLKAYADANGPHEPLYNTIGDLLSDIMHLCDLLDPEHENEHDFESILWSAQNRYEEEKAGE